MTTENVEDLVATPEMIAKSPLGVELSESQCISLASKAGVVGLNDSEFLLEKDEIGSTLYVIISGQAEVVVESIGGDMVSLHLLREGDMAGELGFLDGKPRSASLRAVGTCIAYTLRREDFESYIQDDPDLMYKVMRAITRTVHDILCKMNREHVEMNNYIYKQHGRY
jgi:CRP/FNR family transcriptional regulator, cyclic AMP receptor protein